MKTIYKKFTYETEKSKKGLYKYLNEEKYICNFILRIVKNLIQNIRDHEE